MPIAMKLITTRTIIEGVVRDQFKDKFRDYKILQTQSDLYNQSRRAAWACGVGKAWATLEKIKLTG